MVAQVIAVAIFVIMFVLITIDKIERHHVTLVCGAATLLLVYGLGIGICNGSASTAMEAVRKTMNLRSILAPGFWLLGGKGGAQTSGINWAAILFIAGMMVLVEGMTRAGVFRWAGLKIAKLVKYKPVPLFFLLMILSAVLGMFIDSIALIMVFAALTVELSRIVGFQPVPMILSQVFCANLGGTATISGDVPNILIGTSLNYSFGDFLTHTGVIAGISFLVVLVYFYLVFRKDLVAEPVQLEKSRILNPEEAILNKASFVAYIVVFVVTVILIVTHALTGLTLASVGLIAGLLSLAVAGKGAVSLLKKVDYKTLVFFMGLFVVASGLEKSGVLKHFSKFVAKNCGDNAFVLIALIIWVVALASAFIDNVALTATMLPVIRALAATGIGLSPMAWALTMGANIGGAATPIGISSAVVGTSVSAKAGHPIGLGEYMKKCVPAVLIVLAISTVYIFAVCL